MSIANSFITFPSSEYIRKLIINNGSPERLTALEQYTRLVQVTRASKLISKHELPWGKLRYSSYKPVESKFLEQNIYIRDLPTSLETSSSTLITSLVEILWNKGYMLVIPANTELTVPVELFTKLPEHELLCEKLIIIVEDNAKLTLIDSIQSEEQQAVLARYVKLIIGKNAEVDYNWCSYARAKATVLQDWYISLEQNARCNFFAGVLGAASTELTIIMALNGQHSEIIARGAYALTGNQQVAITAHQKHQASYTKSNCLMKGTVRDRSFVSYAGTISIDKSAMKSDSSQDNATLILSSNARAISVPSLEVLTHVVQCAHGSAIGKFSPEYLFYLQSRGLESEKAQQMLFKSFFEPVLQTVQPGLKETVLSELLD